MSGISLEELSRAVREAEAAWKRDGRRAPLSETIAAHLYGMYELSERGSVCEDCAGVGHDLCHECEGSGVDLIGGECELCHGDQTLPCPTCGGPGEH